MTQGFVGNNKSVENHQTDPLIRQHPQSRGQRSNPVRPNSHPSIALHVSWLWVVCLPLSMGTCVCLCVHTECLHVDLQASVQSPAESICWSPSLPLSLAVTQARAHLEARGFPLYTLCVWTLLKESIAHSSYTFICCSSRLVFPLNSQINTVITNSVSHKQTGTLIWLTVMQITFFCKLSSCWIKHVHGTYFCPSRQKVATKMTMLMLINVNNKIRASK